MLNELRHARDVISMEAVAGGTATDKAAERLPSFLDKASEFLSKTVFAKIGDFLSIKNLGWLALNAQRKPFSEMRGIPVVVPQGFKGSLVEYGSVLIKAVEATEDLESEVLSPFGSWVGQRIADPASLKNLTNTLRIPGLQPLKVDALQKQLDRFFPTKTDVKVPIYGDIFKRQADWGDLNNQIKKLNTLYTNGKFEKVQAKVSELSQLMEVLSQRIVENKTEYELSSVTTEQLSKITFDVAEQIEFYGVLRHRVEEFLNTVTDNVDLVKANV